MSPEKSTPTPMDAYEVPAEKTDVLDAAMDDKQAFADEVNAQPHLVEIPESVRENLEKDRLEREARETALRAEMADVAMRDAQHINDTRPAGMSPTLPTGDRPVARNFGPTTPLYRPEAQILFDPEAKIRPPQP